MQQTSETPAIEPSSGYPLKGERIAPVWRQLWWGALADGDWHPMTELVDAAVNALPAPMTVARKTVENLLSLARRNGLLERQRRYHQLGNTNVARLHTFYRRKDLAG